VNPNAECYRCNIPLITQVPELQRLCEYAQTSFTVTVVAVITMAQGLSKMRMIPRSKTTTVLCVLALAALGATPLCAQAVDPTGTWLNEDKDGIIKIGDCGVLASAAPTGALCGTVVWLKNPIDPKTGQPQADKNNVDPAKRGQPIMGMKVVFDMKATRTAGRWDGRVYDLDSGKTYDGSLIVKSATEMRVQGCLLLICQGEDWVRQTVPETAKPQTTSPRPAPSRPQPLPPSPAQPRAR
jgi:uncharacterized protein (DUF2147 family)